MDNFGTINHDYSTNPSTFDESKSVNIPSLNSSIENTQSFENQSVNNFELPWKSKINSFTPKTNTTNPNIPFNLQNNQNPQVNTNNNPYQGDLLKAAFDNLQPGAFGSDNFGKVSGPTDSYGRPLNTDFKSMGSDPSLQYEAQFTQKDPYQPQNKIDQPFGLNFPNSGVYSDNQGNTYGMPKSAALNNNQLPDSNVPITGALLNSIGPASQLIGSLVHGADKTKFDRINPELVNYDPAINLANRTAAGTRGTMRAGVVNNARTSGQLLSNLTAGNVAIDKNLTDTITGIKMNERNQNVGIMNNAKGQNAQIQMQEQIANEQNKAAYRQAIYSALGDLGNIGAGYVKDNAMLDAQTLQNNRALNMLSSLPYRATYDINGNLILKP